MSTALTCQDLSFVGGQRYNCPYPASTSLDSVDVSRETLASFWSAGPLKETSCQNETPQHEAFSSSNYETWPDTAWTDQLSPHLQRNKQLQDALIQREEELARLHEENNKLKEFLSSSFVKDLEEKKMKLLSALSADGRKKLKRSLQEDPKGFQNLRTSQLLQGRDVKRTCRNLSMEFCSEGELANSPPVDYWILQTLGLTDINTIDTSTEYSFNSSYNSIATPCPDLAPSVNYCQPASHEPYPFNYALNTGCDGNVEPPIDRRSNFNLNVTPTGTTVQFSPETTASSKYQANSLQSTKKPSEQPPEHPRPFSPILPSSSATIPQVWGSGLHHTPKQYCHVLNSSPEGHDPMPHAPATPRSRTDVAFSMSLSPSSSVKTHSFPQGQAFVRKDTIGRWNFTWVPKQDP